MRLNDRAGHPARTTITRQIAVLALAASLAACSRGGDGPPALSSADSGAVLSSLTGPAGDYPVILGEPYTVEGQLYTPTDTTSYDEVGYAAPDAAGGTGVTASHKTLPLPSYVEVTSLESGKTVLVRVERRGPMTSSRLIALSPAAQTQLGSSDGTPVRVRRVNPPETERAKLRSGEAVAERMETPQSLVAVLKRKLPPRGSANLDGPSVIATPAGSAAQASQPPAAKPVKKTAVANAPVAPKPAATSKPESSKPEASKPKSSAGRMVVQAATFSNKASADKVASQLGGFVTPAGKYHRVQLGPFTNRGQADAALAKARSAGYKDARILTSG